MGQKFFYIITPIQINLPIEVVHFKEKDVYTDEVATLYGF